MSNNSKLMDTEPGGEQTQYEGEYTHVIPHAKLAGQMSDPATGTTTSTSSSATNEPNTVGITPAEKIRYGQSIQEGGMGGKTEGSMGHVNAEGGFGGTEALDEERDGVAKQRREQGYGGARDMDKNIGA